MEATIVVKDLRKTFRQSAKQMKINHSKEKIKVAVDGISFETFPGEIFGLLGPNGAGKTTTLRCIATLIRPDSGEIKVKGIDASDELAIKKSIAFLTNEIRLEDQMTPNYAFDYYARFHEMPQELIHARRKELFDYFGINDFSEVKIGDLSTGMKQKVSIAVSLAHESVRYIKSPPAIMARTEEFLIRFTAWLVKEGRAIFIAWGMITWDMVCR